MLFFRRLQLYNGQFSSGVPFCCSLRELKREREGGKERVGARAFARRNRFISWPYALWVPCFNVNINIAWQWTKAPMINEGWGKWERGEQLYLKTMEKKSGKWGKKTVWATDNTACAYSCDDVDNTCGCDKTPNSKSARCELIYFYPLCQHVNNPVNFYINMPSISRSKYSF